MAIPYAPSGRRVGLEGPNSRNFNPVQTYDNSEKVMRQGAIALDSFAKAKEFELNSRAKDLEAIVSLSDTASKFLVDRQKGINEDQRKLGIADILNQTLRPKPEAVVEYKTNVQRLETTAFQENAAITELGKTDPVSAVQIREDDPVVNGWRAYGQAQGRAQQAAALAPSMLNAAMQSNDPVVPLPGANGEVEMVSPAEAMRRGPSAFQAAWAVTMQGFIQAAGIGDLNPILLAESVSPVITDTRVALLNQSLKVTAQRQQGEAKDQFQSKIASDLVTINTADQASVADWWNQTTLNAKDALGVETQTEANTSTLQAALAIALTRGEGGQILIDNLSNTVVNPNDPNGVTLSQHQIYGPMLVEASQALTKRAEKEAEQTVAYDKEAADQVWRAFEQELSQANDPKDHVLVKAKARDLLKKLGTVQATDYLIKLDGLAFTGQDDFRDGILARLGAGDKSITKKQIENHILKGELASSDAQLFQRFFPEPMISKQVVDMKGDVKQEALGAIKAQFKNDAIPPDRLVSGGVTLRASHLTDEVMQKLMQFSVANPGAGMDKLRQHASDIIARAVAGDPRYKFVPAKTDPLRPEWAIPLVKGVVPAAPGSATSRTPAVDYSSVAPIDIKGGRTTDFYGGPLDEAGKQIQAGKDATKEINARAKAAGLTVPEFVAQQQGLPRASRIPAMQYESVLLNPRSTALQKQAAQAQKAYVRANQPQRKPAGSAGGRISLTGPLGQFASELGSLEGGARAWDASNMGGAGDKPGGVSGLSKMTVNQVLALPDHHVGMYQLQLGKGRTLDSLKTRMGLTGNEPFTPELQNRMFTELMFGGWKRPTLTAYLKGGGNLAAAKADFINEWEAGSKMDLGTWLPKLRAQYLRGGMASMGGTANFSRSNVTSVSWERPGRGDSHQPGGVDLYFEDKQFPALAPGRVVDVDFDPGYGNFVVTEHKDPVTGETFQLINAHLDSIRVKVGDSLQVGTVLGKQGSSGTTSAGGIASIDPLEPAPRGSKSTRPYRRPEVLKELLRQQGLH